MNWSRLLALLFLIMLPIKSYALAGWAEFDYDFVYSKNLILEYNDPSDSCPRYEWVKSQRCITFRYADENLYLDNLEALVAVNLPVNKEKNTKYILGKSYKTSNWIIYDLETKKIFFEDNSIKKAVDKWIDIGNNNPKIIKLGEVRKNFEETPESKSEYAPNATLPHIVFSLSLFLLIGLFFILRLWKASFISIFVPLWLKIGTVSCLAFGLPNAFFAIADGQEIFINLDILSFIFSSIAMLYLAMQFIIVLFFSFFLKFFGYSTEYLLYPNVFFIPYYNFYGHLVIMIIGFMYGLIFFLIWQALLFIIKKVKYLRS